MRRWITTFVVRTACLLPCALSPLLAASEEDADAFRDVLTAAGIDGESLAVVPAKLPLDREADALVRQVLFRLDRLGPPPPDQAAVGVEPSAIGDMGDSQRGGIIDLRGRVVQLERANSRDSDENESPIYYCRLRLDGSDSSAVIWTHHVPAEWVGRRMLNERSTVRGVIAGVDHDPSGQATLILLAGRIAWHPDQAGHVGATVGRNMLGELGVDVGLLDEVRHDTPLTRHDHAPFYSLLAAVRKVAADELVRAARASLSEYVEPWRHPGPAGETERNRQRSLLATAVMDSAAEGRYSVAPLFLDAARQTGQLLSLEGIARRAIRVEVAESAAAGLAGSAEKGGLDHYFELEVFTSDSQNLPIVCCAASLPQGFPLGDKLRERVRVAGFFLKKWRYDSRLPRDAGKGPLRFQLTSSPLLIAAEPQWPLAPANPSNAPIGWLAGTAFVVLVAIVVLTAWMWSVGDRRSAARAAHSVPPPSGIGPPADP